MWTLNDIWAFVHVQSSGDKSYIILCNKFFLKVAVGGLTSSYWPGCKLLIFIRLFCIMLYPKWGFLKQSWHWLFMMSKMRLWLMITWKIFAQCKHIFLYCKIFTQCKHSFLYSQTKFSYTMETKIHNANNWLWLYYEHLQSVLQGYLPILKDFHGI